jgi:glycosyltransferase involved in cell wall biosynthesis
MSELPALSCMVLYKNELAHLQRVVPKLLEVFDELVMVTNQERSTDGSDEYLESLGIEPQRMTWVEDFSAARQFGLARCRGDYTLWMDCDDDIITSLPNWKEARLAIRQFLGETRKNYYYHRIYQDDRKDYWVRENWFRRDSGVRVKYPTHELYICQGPAQDFPAGLLDRVNAPLKPDYAGKLWRYFDMLYRYLRDVDPEDARCKFYLAREFRGPSRAHVALFLDFWETALRGPTPACFTDECWTALSLYEQRAAVDPAQLLEITEQLVVRHPFEFLSHAIFCMVRCEQSPTAENAERYYNLLRNRSRYSTTRMPVSRGWYFDKALNSCGYYLYRAGVHTESRHLAELAVEILKEAEKSDCIPEVADLVRNNLRIAENWLLGFDKTNPKKA